MTPRKPPDAVMTEAIQEGLTGASLWTFRRRGAERIITALKAEGYLVLHVDVLVGINQIVQSLGASGSGLSEVLSQLVDGAAKNK